MSPMRRAALLLIVLCFASVAGAQVVWVPYEGNPIWPPPEPGTWCDKGRWVTSMVLVDDTYHLFFQGVSCQLTMNGWAIGHATSTDGINWEMDPANPVMTPQAEGNWRVISLINNPVIHDGREFRMWYCGWDGSRGQGGYATSPDGTTWTRHPDNPIFRAGPDGSIDDTWACPGAVIFQGGLYHTWYGASPETLWVAGGIGYATSIDGLSWTKHPGLVFEPGEGWENGLIGTSNVIFDGTTFHMWYVGQQTAGPILIDSSFGYAMSEDGISWTRDPANPIEEFGDTPGTCAVFRNAVDARLEALCTNDVLSEFDPVDFRVNRATAEFSVPMDSLLFIPAAALAAGAEGSFFQTDVDVNSTAPGPSMMPISYRFWWLPRGQNNAPPIASEVFVLDPGESMRHENILASVFDLEPNALGSLAITADSESLIAMSRTYNLPTAKTAGTFGQALPGVPFDELITTGESRRITFMSENADTRANLGCVNGTDTPVTIDITERNAAGAVLETRTMSLGPWSNKQVNQILEDFQPVNGSIDVSTSTEDAAFFCYGSVLDNLTSDPTSVLPQTPSASTMSFVPATALAGGAQGSFFQTDVDLNNAGDTMSTYSFLWLPRGENNSSPTASDTFTLDAGESVRYENVLAETFSASPDALGALALSSDGGNVLVMSRTYNIPSVKIAGTFGQALEGIPADRLLHTGDVGRIIFLTENHDIRANIGCVNGTDTPVAVDVAVYDATGTLLETRTMNLAAWSNRQINQILEDFAPVDGYVDVSSATPGAAFTCYGSVLDNTTSDPTTIPPQ
jgi:predicted GH43/DUF377 family glycosyl hydrolase